MKARILISLYVFLAPTLLGASGAAQQITMSCAPIGEPRKSFEGASIAAGEYNIIFVTTEGDKLGAASVGQLWLYPTSSEDQSFHTGEGLRKEENIKKVPLYGSTNVDFAVIGAPMDSHNKNHPDPKSRDPIYPGVLVQIIDWYSMPKGQIVLTIGTLSNPRAGPLWTDGAGIGLWVRTLEPGFFAGSWGQWGLLKGGSGHFCAKRVLQ